jgi:phosphatidylglycerol:prolipoprotein diacylglycerol transferase
MCPVLYELGPLPGWAGALMALACAGVALVVERAEQRRRGVWPDRRRAALVGVVAGLVGLALWAALRRWGPVPVRAWGTMLMLGFLAGMAWALYDARDDQAITLDLMIDLTLVILVGAIVGARLMSVALEWHSYADGNRSPWRIWEGGLSFHGGLIGGTLAGIALIRHRGLSVRRMVDLLAPSVALGYAITRIGCFLNGCCYGAPTDSAWGVHFPALDPAQARHPTQLYSSALSLVIFGVLLGVRGRLRRPGHLFLLYLILMSAARFGVEHFRRGASAEVFGPLAPLTWAQVASIAIALAAGAWMAIDTWRADAHERAEERERAS